MSRAFTASGESLFKVSHSDNYLSISVVNFQIKILNQTGSHLVLFLVSLMVKM